MQAFSYDWKMEIYWRMPVFVQETVLSLYSRYLDRLYYGPTFDKWLEYFAGWKNWSLPATLGLARSATSISNSPGCHSSTVL